MSRSGILQSKVILFYPSKPDLFIFFGLFDKIRKSLFKFFGTFPRCINISDTNSFVGRRKFLIIFPCQRVAFYCRYNIRREYKLLSLTFS